MNIQTDGHFNRLIEEELCHDLQALEAESIVLTFQLNPEQLAAFQQITSSIFSETPGFYFVSGFGGTGKTFLWNAIVNYVRSKRKIMLTVASSGVAALLLPSGRTAHSRFKIPLEIHDTIVCDAKRGSMLADLIAHASLIIWDEALMTHRQCFETLDRTFHNIMSINNPDARDIIFGGKIVVLGGDLRQILLVIEGGHKVDIINASIVKSSLWRHVKILKLTTNMRLSSPSANPSALSELASFSKWILDLGEGKLPTESLDVAAEPAWIEIPFDLLIHASDDKIDAIVNCVYADILNHYLEPTYLCKHAILTPTNETADEVNTYILNLIPGKEKVYLSHDCVSKSSDSTADGDLPYPIEFLNSLTFSSFPQHRLVWKKGVPIMLLRNLSQSEGLCNGTRLIIYQFSSHNY